MHEPARECRPYLSLNRASLPCVHFTSKCMVESSDVHQDLALLPARPSPYCRRRVCCRHMSVTCVAYGRRA